MSADLPSTEHLQHIAKRLVANDIPWFRDRFRDDDFDWLRGRVTAPVFEHVAARVEVGDLDPLRGVLRGLDTVENGTVFTGNDLGRGTAIGFGAVAAAGGAGAAASAKGRSNETGRAALRDDTEQTGGARDGSARGRGVVAAGTVIVEEEKGLAWWKWAVPLLLLIALAAGVGGALLWNGNDKVTTTTAAAPSRDLVETALSNGAFTTLGSALGSADLIDTLKGPGPFTVFAPTDAAFAKLPDGVLAALVLPENKATLRKLLQHHVVSGSLPAAKLQNGPLTALDGSPLDISVGGAVTVNDAKVEQADIAASNGTIHRIDTVLVPDSIDINALLGIATTTSAPAATTLPATTAPATTVPATLPPTTTAAPAPANGVLDVAGAAGDFSTLISAIEAAGLNSTLSEAGPFTIFAPTNDAFAKIPKDQLDALLANPEQLSKVLGYHVVAGRLASADLVAGKLTTLDGEALDVTQEGNVVKVNGVTVQTADVEASNGLIHVIDEVLRPPSIGNEAGDFISEDQTIYFDSGAAAIRRDQKAKVVALAERLRAVGGGTLTVTGFTDSQGDPASNLALSERRVATVADALAKELGAAEFARFTVQRAALGDARQQATLALSRRVTVSITPS